MHEKVETSCLQFLDMFFMEGNFTPVEHIAWGKTGLLPFDSMQSKLIKHEQRLPLWITQAIKKSCSHAFEGSLNCLGARLQSGSYLKHLLVSVGDGVLQRVVKVDRPARWNARPEQQAAVLDYIQFHTGSEEWAGNAASIVFSVPQKLRELKKKKEYTCGMWRMHKFVNCPRHGMVY